MTRKNSSLVWWSRYFIFTQTLLVISNLTSSSGKKSDEEVIKMISFDHRYNDTMARPTEKRFLKDFYLGRTNRRSRGLAPENQTMKSSKEVELGDNTDKETPLQPSDPTFPPGNRGTNAESCSNRCSNRTYFASSFSQTVPRCQCDSSCNDIFTDCCSDYTRHCSNNVKPVESREPTVYLARSYFRCMTQLKYSISPCFVPPGVWMISRCPGEWSNDFLRDKCHEPSSTPENGAYDSFAPVFSRANQLTYRNQYCALCHNVVDYELWSLVFRGRKHKNVTKFLAEHGRLFLGVKPRDDRPLRYCFFPSVVKTCTTGMNKSAHERCVNGSVEIVRWESGMKYYKNRACALCHGVTSPSVVQQMDPKCFEGAKPITHAVDLNSYSVTLRTAVCPRDQVFDPHLGACRRSYRPLPLRNGSKDTYRVVMSLLYTTRRTASIVKSFLRDDLASNFNLNRSQITDVRLLGKVLGFVITFTLRLTPLQSVIFALNALDVNGNETFGLRRLFRFKTPFDLTLFNEINFTVYHLITQRLTCIHRRVYSSEEFVVLRGQRIFVNSTGVTYRSNEYDLNKSNRTSAATVCLKLAPSQCNTSYISLVPSEYDLLSNLTLVYHSSKHDFGDYAYKNGTVAICVGFKRKHSVYTSSSKMQNDLAITVLNMVGFICSVACLLILIVTYWIFKELRTLPGKNLMSLAVSLAFAELFWLCGSVGTVNQGLCTAFAIANHYFFLVYFTASSVIAFHTCSVFGRSIAPRRSQEENIEVFRIYSVVTWGIPALFVLTFSLLDHYEVFMVNYGSDDLCWLGTTQSKLYLFVLPFAVLLLFNLILFVFVAVSIRKSNTQIHGANDTRPSRNTANLVICMKLSSLMGFSWLFVLLHIIAGSETDAFIYLFVIFVSLEGIFVSGAFLFNRKCFELYRRLIMPRKPETTCDNSARNKAHAGKIRRGNNFTQETKL